ncbi:hypothetical protein DUI87_01612 [Hirundo rustica rustica]|uniref:Integrase-type domain-containing protein n=1 Tax=Hirundo rustica rustica TaxID=333673 RepID=A0A3M0LCI3_HIRRU|nr:hypothetical protein DUI87_01612 [Hirundo rustica rustica]
MVRDPETGRTEGPHDLVTWGRGYACVSTPTGLKWLPSKWGQERSYQFVYQTKDVYTAKIWCGRIAHVEMASTTDRKPLALPKALGELAHLECWVAKQANLTSNALAGLLSDEEVTRQAMLQNRAAIDYLLLLNGHRCEEFEGLCCFNLSMKAEDVHKAIQNIQGMVEDIKKETGDWLSGMFGNWGISGRRNPEWCGEWEDMGQLLKEFSDPVVWDFPREQIQNPVELGKYLKERYHDGSKGEKIAAVSWALAYAYRTLLETVGQQTEAGGKGYRSTATPVTQAAANTPVMKPAAKLEPEPESAAKADSKPKPLAVALAKKHTLKTDRPVDDDDPEKDLHQNQKPKLLAQDQKPILIPFP